MKVLAIERDLMTVRSVKFSLQCNGMDVTSTDRGAAGVELAARQNYDVIILGANLPDMTCHHTIGSLRAVSVTTPIITLVRPEACQGSIERLVLGGDDFILAPFATTELLVRVQLVTRRSIGMSSSSVTIGPLVVNIEQKLVTVAGRPLHLTGKEYEILELLVLRKDTTLTKECLLRHLYEGMEEPEARVIDVFVCKLRKKIAAATGGVSFIETDWGRGYVLRDPTTSVIEPL